MFKLLSANISSHRLLRSASLALWLTKPASSVASNVFMRRYTCSSALLESYNAGKSVNEILRNARYYLPQHTPIPMPAMSPTMKQGNIVSWKKKEGDKLTEGDLMCEIETDKAVMGFEAPEDGYLAKIILGEGTKDAPVGKLLCIIVPEQSDIAAFANFTPTGSDAAMPSSTTPVASSQPQSAAPPPSPPQTAPIQPVVSAPPSAPQGHIGITPYAKKLAQERGINLQDVKGSGPGGRILGSDLSTVGGSSVRSGPVFSTPYARKLAAEKGVSLSVRCYSTGVVDMPLSAERMAAAQRAIDSKRSIPNYYLSSFICLDETMKLKDKINSLLSSSKSDSAEITLNEFILKASAVACTRIKEANSFFMDTFIRQNNNVDISVAVKTASGDLVYPVVFDAHLKGLTTIRQEIDAMKAKAMEGSLSAQDTEGGTFTVSNMGDCSGVQNFAAIIFAPQACHLAVGHPEKRVIPNADGGWDIAFVIEVNHLIRFKFLSDYW
ncbi:unnamed protein product [Anisakis simplex]|uniref:Dihydrolipoamide acetyltransferase component of pyruvate dehydrogenase complex n=1 Tax=Anisakis simplex TaxID=6269 RepID=A0A0M3J0L7_ANISI|nr:unnamed protein product [Anisakis simplex]